MGIITPNAVLFDWDNTLVNTWPIIHQALFHTFEDMGKQPWSFEETKARVRHSMRDSFPKLFGDDWQKASDAYQHHYRAIHLKHLEALPKAEEVLKLLAAKGLYVAVVSNKKGPNLRTEISHLGWDGYFKCAVGAGDAEQDKPSAAPVVMAMQPSGRVADAATLFIGDSVIDIECAKHSGCSAMIYGDITSEQQGEPKDGLYQGFPYIAHVMDHTELHQWFCTHL